jgi:hypothetical protein
MAKTLADEYHGHKCHGRPLTIREQEWQAMLLADDNEPDEWLNNAEREIRRGTIQRREGR